MDQSGYRMKGASYSYLQARAEEARRFQRALKELWGLGRHETVVFQDETGFSLNTRLERGWAKRGQRLSIATTSCHYTRLNLSGWVAPLLGRRGMTSTVRGNREGFLEALRHLYRRLHGYTALCGPCTVAKGKARGRVPPYPSTVAFGPLASFPAQHEPEGKDLATDPLQGHDESLV
jgi:hypothetical protein